MAAHQRVIWLDALRGFAILLVVAGHVIQSGLCPDDYSENMEWLFIYSFHMPLFFFISGYASRRRDSIGLTVRKRCGQLVIPFLAWLFVRMAWEHDSSFNRFLYFFVNPSGGGLWFLWVLFFVNILDIVAYRSFEKKNAYFVLSMSFFCALLGLNSYFSGKYGLNELSMYYVFYVMGGVVMRLDKKRMKTINWKIPFVLFLLLFFFDYYLNGRLNYQGSSMDFMIATCAIFALKCYWEQHEIIFLQIPYLCRIGRNTLGIYASHFYFIFVFFHFVSLDYSFIMLVLVSLVIILFSLKLVDLLKFTSITQTLFLGNPNILTFRK